ncbi:MAG: sigma-54 dependent transcriptional regulator [Chitinispirillales bacterium]|jgi:DNA-binding NtrC family response regulator|nr:sigma-54 dependent transcriptional regulator [Chitinispirillales bacterium]
MEATTINSAIDSVCVDDKVGIGGADGTDKEGIHYFGSSPSIESVKNNVDSVAATDCAVLILGDTGTGKSVLARRIHDHSSRNGRAFIDINCSALRGELLKSEVLGHARGSFTGAVNDRVGLVEAANGGTLFLDEIGDMPVEVQSLLLKIVEEKTFRRVGENTQRSSDFRLICATNRNLRVAVTAGKFREDLFYRINTFHITLPSLRDRREDIPGLVGYLLKKMGYTEPLNRETMELLTLYRWPGNIRQLQNGLERALIYANGEPLCPKHFTDVVSPKDTPPLTSGEMTGGEADDKTAVGWNLGDIERVHILRTLERFGGDKMKASEVLGISLSTLYRKLDKFWGRGE